MNAIETRLSETIYLQFIKIASGWTRCFRVIGSIRAVTEGRQVAAIVASIWMKPPAEIF